MYKLDFIIIKSIIVAKKTKDIGDGTQFDINDVHTKTFFNKYFCDLKDEEIEEAITQAYKEFYLRPNYVLKRFLKIRNINDFSNNIKSGIYTLLFTIKND